MKKLTLKITKASRLADKELDIIQELLSDAYVFYIPRNFDFSEFSKSLLNEFREQLQVASELLVYEKNIAIEFENPLKLLGKLGMSNRLVLFVLLNGPYLLFRINTIEFWEKGKKNSRITDFLKNDKFNEIENVIIRLIQNSFEKELDYYPEKENIFYQPLQKIEFAVLHHAYADELILACMPVENIREENNEAKQSGYFVQSQKRQMLLSDQGDMLAQSELHMLKEADKKINWNNYQFSFAAKNKKTNLLMLQMPANALQSIRFVVRQNFIYQKKLLLLHQALISIGKNEYDELIYELKMAQNDENYDTKRIVALVNSILTDEIKRQYFTQWTEDWQLSSDEQFQIIQLFLEYANDTQAIAQLLPTHRKVREYFMKKNKDLYEQAFFDLGFSRHLIAAGELEEAQTLIQYRLKNLPDETIWDLLPADDTNLDNLSGQYLRINYLKLLKKLSTGNEKIKVIENIAQLQPLNLEHFEEIRHQPKFGEVYQFLAKNQWEEKPLNLDFKQKSDEKIIKKVEHPLSSQNKLVSKIQKWLADDEKGDYHTIKQYAENLTAEKYPEQKQIIDTIAAFLRFEQINGYISYGQKSAEFTAFDDKIPFLLIGADFLDTQHPLYLNANEFSFLAGVECANLFLGYSYITSSDLWKGATQKGLWAVDTLLSVIPFTGTLGTALKNASKMEKIGKWAVQMEKLGQWASTGIGVVKSSFSVIEKVTQKQERQVELLLQSRLMQINADRIGLLINGDIGSALWAILKIHEKFTEIKPRIEKNGWINFLSETNSDGELKQRDLSLRIAALISFYLSDDFNYWYNYFRTGNKPAKEFFYK